MGMLFNLFSSSASQLHIFLEPSSVQDDILRKPSTILVLASTFELLLKTRMMGSSRQTL